MSKREKTSFESRLESEARKIVSSLDGNFWNRTPLGIIDREIAFTINQIDHVRELHENIRLSLLHLECYIDTDYMALNWRIGWNHPDLFVERDKLKRKLADVEKERRQMNLIEAERTQVLHERLLTLVNRHRQLKV